MKENYLCALLKDVAESSISRVICRDMFRKSTKMALLVKVRKNSSVQRLTVGRLSNMLPSSRSTKNHMVRNTLYSHFHISYTEFKLHTLKAQLI